MICWLTYELVVILGTTDTSWCCEAVVGLFASAYLDIRHAIAVGVATMWSGSVHTLLCNCVIFIDQLYRHGDCMPISEYPSDKVSLSSWYEGLGQLSGVSSPYPL